MCIQTTSAGVINALELLMTLVLRQTQSRARCYSQPALLSLLGIIGEKGLKKIGGFAKLFRAPKITLVEYIKENR
jgi:hypothetical protein